MYLYIIKTNKIMKNQNNIKKAYNEFRNNVAPLMQYKVEIGALSVEAFQKWFDQRETTFFTMMDKAGI